MARSISLPLFLAAMCAFGLIIMGAMISSSSGHASHNGHLASVLGMARTRAGQGDATRMRSLRRQMLSGIQKRGADCATPTRQRGVYTRAEILQDNAAGMGGDLSAVVVGAGVGGLAVASRLAKSGKFKNVTILEKNAEAGSGAGRLAEIKMKSQQGEYRFETGPSLMLLPDVYRSTFAKLGLDLDSLLEIKRVMPAFKVHFADGVKLVLSNDEADMKAQLDKLEPDGYAKYKRYMDSANINLDAGLPLFIEQDFSNAFSLLPKFLINALTHWPLKSHIDNLGEFFETDRMKALFSFQDLYIGLSPYDSPGVFNLLQSIEYTDGIYYPVGGFTRIADELKKACESLGIDIVYDAPVSEISVDPESKVAKGVQFSRNGNPEFLPADMVVANPDLPWAEKNLLQEHAKRPNFDRTDKNWKYSSSVVSFCWAVDKSYPEALGHHSLFLSNNYKKSWEGIFGNQGENVEDVLKKEYQDFNFYVHTPTRTDPSCSPEGHDSIMVLVPAPPMDESMSVQEQEAFEAKLVEQAREGVIRRFEDAGMKDFRDHIVQEAVRTPLKWKEMYNLNRGAVFGIAHPMTQLSIFRPGPKHPIVPNLYYVGASARPGNGVPLVLIGAQQVADTMLAQLPSQSTVPVTP
mmetsp:Transcript_2368/g.3411  ORF Transcript_2368/g.3411 Transcript_2368/m.3411 type:complete len:634 (-) Transcript_2368:193-2094(-)